MFGSLVIPVLLRSVLLSSIQLSNATLRICRNLRHGGGVIELACFVHLFPVDIYVFRPYPSSCRMEWMTTFATSLPACNHVNDCLLLYSGNNHYDSIIDATFGRCHLASLVVSDDVAGRDVGVSSTDSSGCVKR